MVFDSEKQSKDLDKSTFDIVRLGEFRTYRCGALISYLGVWFLILLKVAILASDTYTCINILVYKRWSTEDYQVYEFKVAKWISLDV
ncbi:CIC11C00000005359 [Sungouiella intermedia]|uniref:CIC11C00000005359 n=1 Tax=Sungouiella intermedia TaxID=45354 RepID=A0A1L0BYB3_9ASCO|nr:CIC11C00000005359 [[Candida] intermedia]